MYYGVYRYWVTVPRIPHDPPRPLLRPYETLAVWFSDMFTNAADTETRMFRVQYRRWGPPIDLTILHNSDTGVDEYTQPYLYMPDEWDDIVVLKVAKEYLFAIGDIKRLGIVMGEIMKKEDEMKLYQATRGDLDYAWTFHPTDRVPLNKGYNLV